MNSDFQNAVNNLQTIVNECCDAFRTGENALGYKKIIEVTENTMLLFSEVQKIKLIEESVHNLILQTNAILSEINEALVNRDDVLIPDLLEYEFLPILEQWKTMVINEIGSEENGDCI